MKKIFILGLVFSLILTMGSFQCVFSAETNSKVIKESDAKVIKEAIKKYKEKNYVGCISDLRLYTEKDPSNAVAWYYLGNAYMNIAMKPDAHAAFEKVIALNTVPKLTSYSIQAQICMENVTKCEYRNFTYDEIKKLKANPTTFLEEYFAKMNEKPEKDADTVEIENLINGSYPNNITPEAREFIRQEKAKMKTTEINNNQAYLPSDQKLAQAVEMLKRQNNDITGFAMMMDMPQQYGQNNYVDLLKQYQGQDSKKTLTPEMIQMMMMSNMMPNF